MEIFLRGNSNYKFFLLLLFPSEFVAPCWHWHIFCFPTRKPTFWTRVGIITIVFDTFTFYMVIAKAQFTLKLLFRSKLFLGEFQSAILYIFERHMSLPVDNSIDQVYYTIHIYNFLTPILDILLDARIDHLHKEIRHKTNIWTFFRHDPKQIAGIQCICCLGGDIHTHESKYTKIMFINNFRSNQI